MDGFHKMLTFSPFCAKNSLHAQAVNICSKTRYGHMTLFRSVAVTGVDLVLGAIHKRTILALWRMMMKAAASTPKAV